MKQSIIPVVLFLAASLVFGCAVQPKWSRYEMCFGLSGDSGKTIVSDRQWHQFRDEEIAKRFPDGFTVIPANGFWRSGAETYREPSRVMIVVAPDTEGTEDKLNAIAQAYAKKFHQQSLLQIKSSVKVDFHSAGQANTN